jgi:MoxR-like ATPase/plastocyanin
MINELLVKDRATKDEIATEFHKSNNENIDYKQVPAFSVLQNHKVVKENDGVFTLIDIEKLGAEEIKDLIKDCEIRKKEFDDTGKIKTRNYWHIHPGGQASNWNEQRDSGVIAIGWNDIGDVSGKSNLEIKELLKKHYPEDHPYLNFKYFMSIKKGDIVIASKGKKKIVGIGVAKGEYKFFSQDDSTYRHTIPVDWYYTQEKDIPIQGDWRKTVGPITSEKFCSLITGSEMTTTENIVIPNEIQKLIVEFDTNRKLFSEDWKTDDEIDKERQEFITQFPIDKISEIELDEYVQGKRVPLTGERNRTTFCYLLENGIESFGSASGGNARKFGIYHRDKTSKYEFDESKFDTVEDAFVALKEELKIILDAAETLKNDGNWNKFSELVDDGDFQIQRHIVSKILAIYFPETFVTIHSNAAINNLLDFFKIPRKEIDEKLQLKKSILNEIKNDHSIIKNWIFPDYGHFLWSSIVRPVKLPEKVNVKVISISKGSSKPGCEETNSCYSPNVIKIKAGDVITWENDDDSSHIISSGTPSTGSSGVFGSELIPTSEIFSHQFEKDGTFHYFDTVHPWMTGQIIVGDQESISEEIEHLPLKFPTKEKLEDGIRKITEDLLIDPETIKEIVINLASGRHILLAGPIGTGKTQLALKIPGVFWTEDNGYYPELYTATSEWSTNDVVGGIMPKMRGEKPIYEIQLGCVSKTVKSNWDEDNPSKRILSTHEGNSFHGTWLVIDEFNRADIDKAIGQLFTSLETKSLKIPTSTENMSFEEVTIPLDYRIIGTLNTADKHHLFKLSDALKRRFAYIEVLAPTIEQKDLEIYYAMKNALGEFEHEDLESMIVIDEENKTIDDNSNQEFLKRVNSAYDILAFIRTIKPLGTAVLKSIYQTLVVGSSITNDLDRSLDSAINVNLIPQLEDVQISSLELVLDFFFGEPIQYFKQKSKPDSFPDKYENEFRILLEFLKIDNIESKIDLFKKGEIQENSWSAIQTKYDAVKVDAELSMFETSLKDLIRTSSML